MADPASSDALALFSAATRAWFTETFREPTAAQAGAWHAAQQQENTLVIAPTGAGKTLAAFLWALDELLSTPRPEETTRRCRVLYVSPLKALAVDVQRNLRTPLEGITEQAHRLDAQAPEISIGSRTGDTPASQRRAFRTAPPDILVTTPESLFLLLTSKAKENLRGVDTVIVDEVHALAGTKRGAHLALSLERLEALRRADPASETGSMRRVGLSATVRPVDEISTFLAAGEPVRVVQPPAPKTLDVTVEVPVPDMTTLDDQKRSMWPSVEQRILDLVADHRSTIVFANSRRIAERLTARLNELQHERTELTPGHQYPADAVGQAGVTTGIDEQPVAKSHHGSMSREQRTLVESELKSGTLPCVVATSSLELGIDMGAVELVVQVEAPPTVASGLQRVGRSGHHVGAASSGVVFPRFRGDVISCAVVAERMAHGAIEALHYPRTPLDVLAQQIVAMLADQEWHLDDLTRVIRRAAPFHELPEDALHAVLDMLSGHYPSTDFGELRPRITWDRTAHTLNGRPGAQRLAVTSGGTIPDRGLYAVVTASTGTGHGSRVGELDEEMVHESRVGDTILLGTSSWRITEITHDRVTVVPAPGSPARMPFWKGDAPARPRELGAALGRFLRELSTADAEQARERARRAGLDEWACDNLLAYVAEQRAATGHVPDDRTIVIERFRDEIGDWRVVVHSPFGAAVNAPWALAVTAHLRATRGLDPQVAHSDDGIVLRLPDSDVGYGRQADSVIATAGDLLLDPDLVEHTVTEEVRTSALFAARFRECAARSLLLPRRDPRRRTPLWQQRQRSSQLLEVAASYPRFPVVVEAMRECLRDVYDVAGLQQLMRDIDSRSVRVVEVETPRASPFARSLLFGYVASFLYNTDTPLAERKATALSLDEALLSELVGSESLRDLLDPDVLEDIERSLQELEPDQHARGIEDTADLLRLLGDLTTGEAVDRGVTSEWLTELETAGRALRVDIAGQQRFIAVEDAGRVHAALGAVLPADVPEDFRRSSEAPLGELLTRYARRKGPFTASEAAARFGIDGATVVGVLDRLTQQGHLVRGQLRPVSNSGAAHDRQPGHGTDYCDATVLRRIRRASLARVRAEVEPVEPAALGRFLPAWQGITADHDTPHDTGGDQDLLACVEQLAGAPIPASALESFVLPARVPGYSAHMLDELTAAGDVVWCGCGALGGSDGWVALAPADLGDLLLPDAGEPATCGRIHSTILSILADGALFFGPLTEEVRGRLGETVEESKIVSSLWDLVWGGVVASDTLAPLRAKLNEAGTTRKLRRSAHRGRYARLRAPRAAPQRPTGEVPVSGRWALVPERETDPTRRAHARTESFLERHGVLTRGALETESLVGGMSGIYPVLRELEESGHVVRGYVVDGLGAAQFAAHGAIDRLRGFAHLDTPGRQPHAIVFAATDPAQPYGAALDWPEPVAETGHRPGRKAGSLVVLVDGRAALYLERGGRSLLSFTEDAIVLRVAAGVLADQVRAGRLPTLSVQRADGAYALSSTLGTVLREVGFRATPQGLRLRGQ